MGFVDLARVTRKLIQSAWSGLLVVSPENFEYFTGVSGYPVTMWRRAGPASILVNGDGDQIVVVPETNAAAVARANPNAQVWSYPMWIESVDVGNFVTSSDVVEAQIAEAVKGRTHHRPETYDAAQVDDLIVSALRELNLSGSRVGVEMDFAPYADILRLAERLPGTELVNSSAWMRELRLVKSAAEIELLRRGVALTEHGIGAAARLVTQESTAADIRGYFAEACSQEARRRREWGFRGASTGMHLGPLLWAMTDPAHRAMHGDLVQFDSSVNLQGYKTDMGRTFAFGRSTDAQRRIQAALLAGYRAGLEMLRPGRRFCDVFHGTQAAVRNAGFPSYARGHVGHSIGSDIDGEEWPWLSAHETTILEPGMVIAFEVPYYLNGIGGFQNEDDILITEDGHEIFNTLPMDLIVLN